MREQLFKQWLLTQGFASSGPVSNAISRCHRIEDAEHLDLDEEFERDSCESLLELYTYTTTDQREENPARHHSLITGDIRNGTASLRSAILKYIEFCRNIGDTAVEIPQEDLPTLARNRRRARAPRTAQPNTAPNRESYSEFFSAYGIDIESLCEYGITNSVFASTKDAVAQWTRVKTDFFENHKLPIRMADTNGEEFRFYKALYRHIFGYTSLTNDATGNYYPRANMERALGIKVTIKPSSETGHLVNFQTSHGFSGRTKNPLMYSSIWNIVFTPKVIDPFTGDEASGEYADAFRNAFQLAIKTRFRQCIKEFNDIVEQYHVVEKINEFQSDDFSTTSLTRMKANALSQWRKIDLEPIPME